MFRPGFLAAVVASLFLTAACGPDGSFRLPGSDQISTQALRSAATDERVQRFYEARNWEPAWSNGKAKGLLDAIAGADRHGIDADRFLAHVAEAPDAAREEAGLTLAALAYAEALSSGMADPAKVFEIYTLDRPKADLVAGLQKAVADGNVEEWLESLAPQDREYRALSDTYLGVRKQIAESKAAPVPTGPTIEPGAKDPRIPAIAAALQNAGFMPTAFDPNATTYTTPMVSGIKGLQNEAGIRSDGVVGDETIAALNSVLNDHAQQLALNLERRRWLAREPGDTRIDVNTASATMAYFSDGRVNHSGRVVVGERGNETPQLRSTMFQLVANPPWNVPTGIAEEEVLPKGPAYMASQGMYVQDGRVIQRPGPKAALGEVKFDMDNKHAIYLHDTPAKSVFASSNRHKSHGCVRVHNAIDFARLLAREQGILDAFDRKLASNQTGAVSLKEKIPVRLLYHTVFLDDAGRLVYLPDPYGWDEKLAASLGMEAPSRLRVDDGVTIPLGP